MEKSLTKENEEFLPNEQSKIKCIYPQNIKNNNINKNMEKINNYSQIYNKYDSDSKIDNINNISSIDKKIDNSSIEPIQMDSQDYSKLFEGIEKGEFNIYSNKNINRNNNKNISSKEENNLLEIKNDIDKNGYTFKVNKIIILIKILLLKIIQNLNQIYYLIYKNLFLTI